MKEDRSGHTTTVVTSEVSDREPAVRTEGCAAPAVLSEPLCPSAPECLLACETLYGPSGRQVALTVGCASTALNDTGFEAHR